MTDSPKQFGLKIAARARRIGWDVELGAGRSPWSYRITRPDGYRVQVHRTPSDRNWQDAIMRELDAGGFTEAEEAWLADAEVKRQARIKAEQDKAQEAIDRAQAQSAAINRAAGPLAPQMADFAWITTPTNVPEQRRIMMTPDVAGKILAAINTSNRKVRPWVVDQLAEQMEVGRYALTHQGGATDSNGVLQDGQHRLMACERSGVVIEMFWTVGMSPTNYGNIDNGTIRNGADMARSLGVTTYEVGTSGAAKLIYLYDTYGTGLRAQGRKRLPNALVKDQIDLLGEGLRLAVQRAAHIRQDVRNMSLPGVAAALYLIQRRLSPDDPRLLSFIHDGSTGANIGEGDPVFALRRMYIRAKNTGVRRDQFDAMALVLKAWKFRAMNVTDIAHLRWAQDEQMPAPYLPPPLDDASEATE